jgi:hypothetical protein
VPKMFLHAPQGAFTAAARARVAAELTELGMACERLIDTPQICAGIWSILSSTRPTRCSAPAARPPSRL